MEQNQRRHVHRSRRGSDRRGIERRNLPSQAPPQQGRDHVDVEQVMRDIRARIVQRNGIDLSNQQIQELAARRLEAILDPRAIKPALLDELRRGAAAPAQRPPEPTKPAYSFEDDTLYDTHRGLLRFMRRLLHPFLKLLFNPTPLIEALHIQARVNVEAAEREAARVRQQAEWNALQYELIQRMVTEVSRVSLEMQALAGKVESLSAKTDFNERRVRSIEGVAHQPRSSNRPVEAQVAASVPLMPEIVIPSAVTTETAVSTSIPASPAVGPGGEGARRRRRRRRGRRGAGPAPDMPFVPGSAQPTTTEPDDSPDEGVDDEPDVPASMSAPDSPTTTAAPDDSSTPAAGSDAPAPADRPEPGLTE